MRREYQREKMKIEYQGKTIQKELKKKIEKKEPAVLNFLFSINRRFLPSNFLKTNKW